jgi:hypothetical protein
MTLAALAPPGGVSTCPSCGRPIRRPRDIPAPAACPVLVDTSRMSDTELYRHYRRTAPVEDLRFFLRPGRISPDLQVVGEALLAGGCRDTGGTLSRTEWYRRLTGLQDRWRRETADVPRGATADAERGAA